MKSKNLHIGLIWKKAFSLCLIIFCCCNIAKAQELKNLEDSIRYYNKLSEDNWHNNIKLSTEIAKENYLLSKKTAVPALRAEALAQYGIAFYSNTQYDSALHYYDKAIQIASTNQLSTTPYLIYKLAVLGKKSHYLEIIHLVDEQALEEDSLKSDLLISQIDAALQIGLTQKADSALKAIEKIPAAAISFNNDLRLKKQKGEYYSKTANYSASDSILLKVLIKYLEQNNILDAAEVYTLLAGNAMSIGRYKPSMEYLEKAEKLYNQVNYQYGTANVLLEKATLYSYLNEFNTASKHLFEALEFFEQNNNLNKELRIYYELGWVFYQQNLFKRANTYLNKSIQIAKKIQNINILGAAYNTKGAIKQKLEQYDSAEYYYNISGGYYQKSKNRKSEAAVLFNKGMVLEILGSRKEAFGIYKDTYKIDLEINNLLGMAHGELVLGKYFMTDEKLDSANYYLDLSETKAEGLNNNSLLLDVYKSKAVLFTKKGHPTNANIYLNKALNHQEVLFDWEKESQIIEIETIYDLKNKEKEVAFLNKEKESNEKIIALNNQKIKSQKHSLIALTTGLILLVILIYIIFKYTQIKLKTNTKLKKLYKEIQEKQEEIVAQSEELQESNEQISQMNNFLEKKVLERTADMLKAHAELDKFFYRASHDFRGPLTTMMGLVEVSKLTTSDPIATNLFDNVDLTAKKLDKMVRKLQAVSFLSDFHQLPEPQPVHMKLLVKEVSDYFLTEYPAKQINFKERISVAEPIIFYPNILKVCLSNLIENSIIFNYDNTVDIKITIELEEDALLLIIEDNGIGIDKEWQDSIFEMFEKSSEISKGNGLGLYLVKKAVAKLNGEIRFESSVTSGTTFYLKFPLIAKISDGNFEQVKTSTTVK